MPAFLTAQVPEFWIDACEISLTFVSISCYKKQVLCHSNFVCQKCKSGSPNCFDPYPSNGYTIERNKNKPLFYDYCWHRDKVGIALARITTVSSKNLI